LFFFWTQAEPGGALDDVALVKRAAGGNTAAMKILVRRLMPVIQAHARRGLMRSWGRKLGPHEGQDFVQEIWLALIKDGGRQLLAYDPERGASLEGYVGMIAEREIGNRLQHERAEKRGGRLKAVGEEEAAEVPAELPDPTDRLTARELASRLGAHVSTTLPERGQLVFRYAFTDGYSVEETAQILGVTVQVVYNWQHKIRQTARAFLG
jgi:RNA polymerase sigma factor (sigma-70 family)